MSFICYVVAWKESLHKASKHVILFPEAAQRVGGLPATTANYDELETVNKAVLNSQLISVT